MKSPNFQPKPQAQFSTVVILTKKNDIQGQQQVPALLIGNGSKMLYYDPGRDNRFYFHQEAHPPIERIPELFSGAKTVGR
jgi:hypothetical protein